MESQTEKRNDMDSGFVVDLEREVGKVGNTSVI